MLHFRKLEHDRLPTSQLFQRQRSPHLVASSLPPSFATCSARRLNVHCRSSLRCQRSEMCSVSYFLKVDVRSATSEFIANVEDSGAGNSVVRVVSPSPASGLATNLSMRLSPVYLSIGLYPSSSCSPRRLATPSISS